MHSYLFIFHQRLPTVSFFLFILFISLISSHSLQFSNFHLFSTKISFLSFLLTIWFFFLEFSNLKLSSSPNLSHLFLHWPKGHKIISWQMQGPDWWGFQTFLIFEFCFDILFQYVFGYVNAWVLLWDGFRWKPDTLGGVGTRLGRFLIKICLKMSKKTSLSGFMWTQVLAYVRSLYSCIRS